ncbi:hypothetical protein L596_015201 [Steinernema carpocapsae]|uniref:Uncharacterized protein n=1 Tax=Steinernema carpocapsae TaxID=34508 RepID=A0A4V6A314_STECR|nr:hypothetical protein L596_015201 [Steinernema carpocapsae]
MSLDRDTSNEFTFQEDHDGIEIPSFVDHDAQAPMFSPVGSTDTGHGESPTSMAATATETDDFTTSVDGFEMDLQSLLNAKEEEIANLKDRLQEEELKSEALLRQNADLKMRNAYIEEHRNEIRDDDSTTTDSSNHPTLENRVEIRAHREHNFVDLLNDTEELNGENRLLKAEVKRLEDLVRENQVFRSKFHESEKMLENMREDRERLQILHDDHSKQIDHLSLKLQEATCKRPDEELIKKLQTEVQETSRKVRLLDKTILELEVVKDTLEDDNESLKQERESMQKSIEAQQEEIEQLAVKLQEAKDELAMVTVPTNAPSERSVSTVSLASSNPEGPDVRVWKLLPRKVRRAFEDYAMKRENDGTPAEKAIKKLHKLTIGLSSDSSAFVVGISDRTHFLSSRCSSVESVLPPLKPETRDALTDCEGLSIHKDAQTECLFSDVFNFSLSETPRHLSQDSIFSGGLLPSRSCELDPVDKHLLDEVNEAGKASQEIANEISAVAHRRSSTVGPVDVSVQADVISMKTMQSVEAENEVFRRTVGQLREDLTKKGVEISKLQTRCDEAEDLAQHLDDCVKEEQKENAVLRKKITLLEEHNHKMRVSVQNRKLYEDFTKKSDEMSKLQTRSDEVEDRAQHLDDCVKGEQKENAVLRKKITLLEEHNHKMRVQNRKLYEDFTKKSDEMSKLQTRSDEVEDRAQHLDDCVKKEQKENAVLRKKITLLEEHNHEMRVQNRKLYEDFKPIDPILKARRKERGREI